MCYRVTSRLAALAVGLLAATAPGVARGDEQTFGVLQLAPTFDSCYARSGELIEVRLDVWGLDQEVKACQAMLAYDATMLTPLMVGAGGGDWDDLIYSYYGDPGEIDAAVGVLGESTLGTSAPGTVAVLAFEAGPSEGVTWIDFRSDVDDVESTFLANMDAEIVWPTRINSRAIIIDNTPPEVAIEGLWQGGQNLLETGARAVQGTATLSVRATDALAGLFARPEVTVTLTDGSVVTPTFASELPPGIFHFTLTIGPATANGPARIEASAADKAGNVASAMQTVTVNKNRITGRVALDRFVGSQREVTFVATGGERREWTVLVTGFSGHEADYVLDDIPDGTIGLSAKTAWNLRRKVAVALDAQGQASADFTGTLTLPGGDLNGDNGVNLADYTLLKQHWLTLNEPADINGDGGTSLTDYTILKSHWLTAGDNE